MLDPSLYKFVSILLLSLEATVSHLSNEIIFNFLKFIYVYLYILYYIINIYIYILYYKYIL